MVLQLGRALVSARAPIVSIGGVESMTPHDGSMTGGWIRRMMLASRGSYDREDGTGDDPGVGRTAL
jgi:hypothetical protein